MKVDLNRLCRLCGEPEYTHDDGECPLVGYNEWHTEDDDVAQALPSNRDDASGEDGG
jgi:hypothetical protein